MAALWRCSSILSQVQRWGRDSRGERNRGGKGFVLHWKWDMEKAGSLGKNEGMVVTVLSQVLPPGIIEHLQREEGFYLWNELSFCQTASAACWP